MTRAEAIIKAKKIHALVVGGATEGERAAAKNRLDAVMKANSLTDADLGLFRTHSQNEKIKKQSSGAHSYHSNDMNDIVNEFFKFTSSPEGQAAIRGFAEAIARHFWR